jgi:hypothetical protein
MKPSFIRLFVALVCILGCAMPVFSQAGADTSKGALTVEVTDPSAAIIPGAAVTLVGPMGEQRAATDVRGQITFFNLVPGSYKVTVEQKGFSTKTVQNINVMSAQRPTVPVQLETGQLTEIVEVTASALQVDVTSTTIGQAFDQSTYVNLPIARNVSNLFSLAPGAAPAGDPGLGSSPAISGASGLENMYIIDGINTTDQGYGSFGVFSNQYGSLGSGVNFDFVKEVQVKTGGFEAQYGQALGGVINIVTQSGGNDFHGALYGYSAPGFGEAEYRQVNPLRKASPQTETHGRSQWDVGVNVGGPIVRDKFFWYGSFNPSWQKTTRMSPPGFALRSQGGIVREQKAYNWVGKLNYSITNDHRIEASGFGDPSRFPESVHRTLLRNDLNSASESTFGTRNMSTKYNGVLNTTTLLNGTFAWNHSYFNETASTNQYSILNYAKPVPGVSAYTTEGGLGFMENNESNNHQYNVMLTKTVNVLGGHQFDIGYGFNDVSYDAMRMYSGPNWALPNIRGIAAADVGKEVYGAAMYLYPTRAVGGTTYTNVYRQVRGNFSDPTVSTYTDYHNGFLQDAWQINKYITGKIGIRWEQQKIGGNLNDYTFAANWAPRLGVVIDPTGGRKTKIFANWGRFFEKIPQDLAVRAMSEEFGYNNIHYLNLPLTPANVVPTSVASPTGTHPTIIAGGTKAMFQEETVVGMERELPGNIVVTGRYVHRNLVRGLEDISGVTVEQYNLGVPQQYVISNPSKALDIFVNPKACTSGPNCDTEVGFTRDSSELRADGQVDGFPDMIRKYKALQLTVDKRFGNNWSLMGNYTLAKLDGNYEGLFRNDNGQSDPNITSLFDFVYSDALGDQFAEGPLPNDRRHILNLYGNYMFRGLNMSLGYRMLTGYPLNKLLAHPGYANAGEIPVGGRGAFGRTPTQNIVDGRVGYDWNVGEGKKLAFAADLFNIFNRKTTIDIDQNFELSGAVPNADFSQPLRVHRPFYSRFSVRFEF